MKKSKFLLLGSVASMAAIPFVAAKCGDTKEEENKPAGKPVDTPAETPGGSQSNPGDNKNPSTENGGNGTQQVQKHRHNQILELLQVHNPIQKHRPHQKIMVKK
nr:variable surface lipoprotein [Mycoplasmopsis agalactiae]